MRSFFLAFAAVLCRLVDKSAEEEYVWQWSIVPISSEEGLLARKGEKRVEEVELYSRHYNWRL